MEEIKLLENQEELKQDKQPVKIVKYGNGYIYLFSDEPNYPSPYEWMIGRENGTIQEIIIDPLTGKEIDDKTQTDT